MTKWDTLSGKGKLVAIAVALVVIYIAWNYIF